MSENMDAVDAIKQWYAEKAGQAAQKKVSSNKKMPVEMAIEQLDSASLKSATRAYLTKAVGSLDMTPLRIFSFYDQVGTLANRQTIFRDLVYSNPIWRATDLQVRIPEENPGTDAVEFFNMNGNNPPEAKALRDVRSNTVGFYGNKINVTFLAQELGMQSPLLPGTNEKIRQVNMQMVRMVRFSNQKLLANTEVTSEAAGNNPQWGGFVTRSTLNNAVSPSTSLTDAVIQGMVTSIANASANAGIGYDVAMVMLVTEAQIAIIRDLMIDRYPGNNPFAQNLYNSELKQRLARVGIPEDQYVIYKPDPGRALLCIHEPDLTAGTAIMFDPEYVLPAGFQINGEYGPWAIDRPTENLTNLMVVFNGESLIDPNRERRAVRTGLN